MPKSAEVNPFKRTRPTPSPLKRKSSSQSKKQSTKEDTSERLTDTGQIPSLAPAAVSQDVSALIEHVRNSIFADMPDRASGMNSEKISEVLRFRRALPPIVSVAHLHALSASSTRTERELAKLMAAGIVRKVVVPGRGRGGTAVGEGVALAEEWKARVRDDATLSDELRTKYIKVMDANPSSSTTPAGSFTDTETRELLATGFLTFPAALSNTGAGGLLSLPGASSLLAISKAGSSASTGTLAAVGGQGAIHASGGGGSTLAKHSGPRTFQGQVEMTFSLPGTGAYLKLLVEARQQLLHLLKQISPRYKEATSELLKEKWNGNTLNDLASQAKRARGEWSGVLPGRTKRWTQFYGMHYEWILAECVGSGVVECFETPVGLALRAR